MGSVWLAEQALPVQRRVAIKVVKSGLFSPQALQRFDVERRALAIMATARGFSLETRSNASPPRQM